MAIADPPPDHWPTLRPPLTEGELRLATFLVEELPEPWEVYLQPRINDIHPDLVALHPSLGVLVYEVKDWSPTARDLWVQGARLMSRNPSTGTTYVTENGVDQAVRYRQRLLERYSTMALDAGPERHKLVTTGVLLSKFTTEDAQRLLGRLRPFDDTQGSRSRYFRIVGGDALDRKDLSAVAPVATDASLAGPFTETHAEQLRWLLREPELQREQRSPLELDAEKLQLLQRPARRRRVRGAAGTGKSNLIAAQAAKWALEGRTVLVVGFNITLWHHLRDLAHRYRPTSRVGEAELVGQAVRQQITFTHLHGWCEDVCAAAGLGKELRSLLGRSKHYPEVEIQALVRAAFAMSSGEGTVLGGYDALCVDEAQDLDVEWWNLLQRSIKPDAPMLLTADPTQGLYGAERRWTDAAMSGAGFSGPWATLRGSHRLPFEMIDVLRDFVATFLSDRDVDLPDPPPQLPLRTCELHWTQVRLNADIVPKIVQQALAVPHRLGISPSDTAVLLATHESGLEFVDRIDTSEGKPPVAHVFGANSEIRRRRKVAFWAGSGAMKASTIHSYKGWEARCVVLGIEAIPGSSAEDKRTIDESAMFSAIYVGLSRIVKSDVSSALDVVCAEPRLEEFGRKWFGNGFTVSAE